MITSFKRNAEQVAESQAAKPEDSNPPSPTEGTDSPGTSLAIPSQPVEGEFNSEDFIIPKLHLVQAVGPLSEKFTPGQIVYNKEEVISDGTEPVNLTVLRIRKRYQENLPWGGDELPRVFDTLEEVRAAGGWIDWRDNERPPFSPILHALVLIRSPFEENPLFPYEFEGKAYGLALWTLRGVSFTRAGKSIITASQFALKDGLHLGSWSLTSKRDKVGMNFIHVPVLRHEARNGEEFCSFALGLLG
ncbi:hypothetical protein [Haloferula sp. A504]|uniref:hypothetical protein n=1 Tax=Haloferula sp. A504 TaxID=3373601 RepID=UPI0031C5EEF8|nr:hypothetical protein [Verrucomicrobiaceae bacterium E54]